MAISSEDVERHRRSLDRLSSCCLFFFCLLSVCCLFGCCWFFSIFWRSYFFWHFLFYISWMKVSSPGSVLTDCVESSESSVRIFDCIFLIGSDSPLEHRGKNSLYSCPAAVSFITSWLHHDYIMMARQIFASKWGFSSTPSTSIRDYTGTFQLSSFRLQTITIDYDRLRSFQVAPIIRIFILILITVSAMYFG